MKVAEHKGCTASASKNGGALMVAGCGIAAFVTGGLALAVCGGSVAAGYVMSESCDGPPQEMTAEDVRLRAEAATGYPRQPSCADVPDTFAAKRGYPLRSPYGSTSRFKADAAAPDKSRKHARQAKRTLRKLEKQQRIREKKKAKDAQRQQRDRRNKGDTLDW